jgi:hypothetical protein
MASAPFSQGYHTGTLRMDGRTLIANKFKWSAYQAERFKNENELIIHSQTRMVFEDRGVMWQIDFKNDGETVKEFEIEIDLIGYFGHFPGEWEWWYPFPSQDGVGMKFLDNILPIFANQIEELRKVRRNIGIQKPDQDWPTDREILESELYQASEGDDHLLYVNDLVTGARAAFGFVQKPDGLQIKNSGGTATWKIKLKPGEVQRLQYVMAYGDEEQSQKVPGWLNQFDQLFHQTKSKWDHRWYEIFKPENTFLSGNVPVLETNDPRSSRVYYMGALTMLYLTHTGLPVLDRVVLTGGPRWGASIMFYWDTTQWADLYALSDPEMFKENIRGWLTLDINKHYGRDYLGGLGVGNGYVANYWAIFQMMYRYLAITRDYDFLDEVINEKTVIMHMEEMSLNWKNLSKAGQKGYEGDTYKLADFGDDPWNLLECVPSYIHVIPSFNAGYVWMMRIMSEIYAKTGNSEKSESLTTEADIMAKRVLDLYAGDGHWYALHPNNERIEIRHFMDFHFPGKYMSQDLSPNMKDEMMQFVETELLTNTWMRAQSQDDVAAPVSDRADHGPMGAYDGWPSATMEAMFNMGYEKRAADFYGAIEPVTYEGVFAQAHELWGENRANKNARVRIPERDWIVPNASCGGSYANVMIHDFFGFAPEFMGDKILQKPNLDRGIYGTLKHVKYDDKYYTITSNKDGLHLTEEE